MCRVSQRVGIWAQKKKLSLSAWRLTC